MNLFEPPKKILEKIVTKENEEQSCNYLYHHEIYHKIVPCANEENIANFVISIVSRIREFYRDSLLYEKNKLHENFPGNLIGEVMKNCYDHSPKDKEIIFGLFLGNMGICYGFNDGGDYFKNEEIKNQWEKKIKITDFDKNTLDSNFQCGVNGFIFPFSDYIHIDCKKGILYCVQMKKNIINSERNQSKLLYNLRLKETWE